MAESWIDEIRGEFRQGPHALASPISLARHLDPAYTRRPHLDYLNERLVQAVHDVEGGQSRFLMVSMPPRSGKSMMTSIHLPAWLLVKHPDWKIGMLSHDQGLATGWGRAVRQTIEENSALGVHIARDAGAVANWNTTAHGSVVSRSIPGQSITGLGFKVMILDDVVKDFASAHSVADREAVWNWWTANSRTRLEPPSLVIAIGTRWHEDDFLGRLLSTEHEGSPDQWEVIRFPAVAEEDDVLGREPGQPLLSPLLDETDEDALARWDDIKQAVGSYGWSALYQQRPVPADGAIFSADWFGFWEQSQPDFEKTVTSWDCAFKGSGGSDYVVGQRWGIIGADRYLIEQVRGRWSFTETLEQMRRFCKGTSEHYVEDKANGTAVIDVLRREISGMIPVNPTNSKEARARAITPQCESGNVYLPAGAHWLGDFLSEVQSFPSAVHDDQVDAMTQALSQLQGVSGPPRVRPPEGMLYGW